MIRQAGHGRRADVWSLGCTLIEMCTGRPPWPRFDNHMAALFHIATATEPPEPPPGLSPAAQDFLARCMRLDPEKRATSEELLSHPFLRVEPWEEEQERALEAEAEAAEQ